MATGRFSDNRRLRPYVRLLIRAVFFILIALLVVYALPPAISLLGPLIVAFVIAFLLNPLVSVIQKKLGVPRQLPSLIIVVVVFLGLTVAVIGIISVAVSQTILLAQNIQGILDHAMYSFEIQSQRIRWLLDYLPGDTEAMLSYMLDNILAWAQTVVRQAADYMLTNTMGITSSVASGIVAAVVFVMATYFLTAEYPKLNNVFGKLSDSSFFNNIIVVKNASTSAFAGYIRAQLLLALLAFVVMALALTIYGQRYSILIALILAIIDLLPIIGTIAVLIPWGIICIISGSVGKGVFLLILGVSYFLLRKLVEPKIVGSQTGISPLLALISVYVGMRLAGIWGVILGLVLMMVLISAGKAGLFTNTVKDIKAIAEDIKNAFWRE